MTKKVLKEPTNNGDKTEKEIKRDDKGRIVEGSAPLNPAGKPVGSKHLSTLLWEALKNKAKNEDGTESDKTLADLVVQRLIKDNIKYGKRTELIFDRIDGQAKQEVDLTSGGETIQRSSEIDVAKIAEKVSAELKAQKTK